MKMPRKWIALVLVLGGAVSVWAQQREENPYTTPEDVAIGAEIFQRRCVTCHGGDGTGGRGPDLTRGLFRYGSSDVALYRTIRSGISASGMPRLGLPEERVWRLISYVRSLSENPRVTIPGDPERGKQILSSQSDCKRCHLVNGEGGRLGPDLSEIGWMRSPQHLRSSILNPNREVDRGYRSVEAVQKGGQVIRGVPLNEDAYSIQLMDLEENLHSLWKSDLEDLRQEDRSWMPSYQGAFTGSELDDLVAYLYSLRRKKDSP